jgi:hypothetical protein
MAIPNTNWSEITTTTLYNRSRKLADNVTKNNALLRRLSQKAKIKPFDGGQAIVQEIEYSENGTYKRYSGYDVLNIAPSEVFTVAQYPIAQAAVAVSISGLEMLQNSGKEKMIDLLELRIGNAERTMQNNLSATATRPAPPTAASRSAGCSCWSPTSPTRERLAASTPRSGGSGRTRCRVSRPPG